MLILKLMAAGKYDILVEQGATFLRTLTLKDGAGAALNLTGWTFRGQIRKKIADTSAVVSFTFATNTPATDGILKVSLTDTQTSGIPVVKSPDYKRVTTKYVYDIEGVKPDGTVMRLLEGVAEISPEVTR